LGEVQHKLHLAALPPYASRYLEAGGTLAELRDILGHANIATTDRYSHANARRIQEMVEGL
jgi:site-specific recombinase XerD